LKSEINCEISNLEHFFQQKEPLKTIEKPQESKRPNEGTCPSLMGTGRRLGQRRNRFQILHRSSHCPASSVWYAWSPDLLEWSPLIGQMKMDPSGLPWISALATVTIITTQVQSYCELELRSPAIDIITGKLECGPELRICHGKNKYSSSYLRSHRAARSVGRLLKISCLKGHRKVLTR